MKRHIFQIRRKDARAGQRDPFYSPERDVAYIGPNVIHGAMVSIEEKFWEPWLREFMDANGIDYQAVVDSDAPTLMAEALNTIIHTANPVVALEAAGFTKLPHAIQMLFYARIGQCFLASLWASVKDVAKPEDVPPASIQSLLADVNDHFNSFLSGCDDDDPGIDPATPTE
jgi:hypothetical protein